MLFRKRGDKHNDRLTDAKAGQGLLPDIGNVTDVNAVNQIIEHIDNLRRDGRKRKPEDQFSGIFRTEIGVRGSLIHSFKSFF